ncbi:MAG: hypothetical protein N3E40_00130 [Dehalococcoidia bacterium]|nr:hypothetical protein [Dehalococcoidia bacterium]
MSKRKHRLVDAWVDPSTGRLSCSRLCLFLVVTIMFPAAVALEAAGLKLGGAWSALSTLAGTLAGIYGFNSALRVWRNGNADG